jgi:hypothetical protein
LEAIAVAVLDVSFDAPAWQFARAILITSASGGSSDRAARCDAQPCDRSSQKQRFDTRSAPRQVDSVDDFALDFPALIARSATVLRTVPVTRVRRGIQ